MRSRPVDYDQGTRRRLLTASLLPAAYQQVATRARAALRRDVLAALGRHDLLLAPTGHCAAPTIVESTSAVKSREHAAGKFFTRRA